MTSTARTSQGIVISIGTGSGGAKTITAISLGNPTIITATAHGFTEGDVVTLAGLTGADAATLNGQTLSVRNVTTNTFAVYIDTTGKTITAAGTATPSSFSTIGNIRSFTGFDGSASEIDVTNLDSLAKEFLLGLVDQGQFSLEMDYDYDNTGHIALRAKQVSGLISNFKVVFSTGRVINFSGFVKKFTLTGGVDAVVRSAVDLRISGPVTGL